MLSTLPLHLPPLSTNIIEQVHPLVVYTTEIVYQIPHVWLAKVTRRVRVDRPFNRVQIEHKYTSAKLSHGLACVGHTSCGRPNTGQASPLYSATTMKHVPNERLTKVTRCSCVYWYTFRIQVQHEYSTTHRVFRGDCKSYPSGTAFKNTRPLSSFSQRSSLIKNQPCSSL
jgi:hypothetical protein